MSTARPFVHPDMPPEEAVWEPREIALPHWLWAKLDNEVSLHGEHDNCRQATMDMVLAAYVCRTWGDPALDPESEAALEQVLMGLELDDLAASSEDGTLGVHTIKQLALVIEHMTDALRGPVACATDRTIAHAIAQLTMELYLARGGTLGSDHLLQTWYAGRRKMSVPSQVVMLTALGVPPEELEELRRDFEQGDC